MGVAAVALVLARRVTVLAGRGGRPVGVNVGKSARQACSWCSSWRSGRGPGF
ncbi:MAG: hypothetical protein ACLTDR_07400 [Adlercreutzia equolifaciens]